MSLIKKLSPQQRLDMQYLGFNPLNDEHVEYYLNGGRQLTKEMIQENIERMGGEKLFKKPVKGYKPEREINPNNLLGKSLDEIGGLASDRGNVNDIRESIKNDMSGYTSSNRNKPFLNEKHSRNENKFNNGGGDDDDIETASIDLFKRMKTVLMNDTSYQEWLDLFNKLKITLTIVKNSKNQQRTLQVLNEIKEQFVESL